MYEWTDGERNEWKERGKKERPAVAGSSRGQMLWCQRKVWRSWIELLCVPPHKVGRRSDWLFRLSPLSPTLASWLKNLQQRCKKSVKTNKKHFKTIPHKFPFVLLNFTFSNFPLKEANHHILFVFHPSAGPERMKKQQKAKWNGNPTSVTSQQRGPRKHTRSQTKLVQVKWIYLLSLLPEEPQPDGFLMGNRAGELVGLQISKIKTSQQAFASWVLS